MDFYEPEDDDEIISKLPVFEDVSRESSPIQQNPPNPNKIITELNLDLDSDIENETQEISNNKDPESTAKSRKPRIINKLDAEKLLGDLGLAKVSHDCKKLKFKGKGHEMEDLDKILSFYQIWGHELYPKLQFKSFIDKVEKICREKRLKSFHDDAIKLGRRMAYEGRDIIMDDEIIDEESNALVGNASGYVLNPEQELDLDLELENAIRERAGIL